MDTINDTSDTGIGPSVPPLGQDSLVTKSAVCTN